MAVQRRLNAYHEQDTRRLENRTVELTNMVGEIQKAVHAALSETQRLEFATVYAAESAAAAAADAATAASTAAAADPK